MRRLCGLEEARRRSILREAAVRALARERSSGVAWRQQRSMPMHIDSPAADTLITAKKLRIRDLETRA